MGEEQEAIRDPTVAPAPPEGPSAEAGAEAAPDADACDDGTVAVDPFASTLTVAATPPPNLPRLEPGRELGAVRLVREIGRGATGAVFHGHHTVLGRDVAVKFLVNVTVGSGDADGLRRFVDEARAAASVRHPNLTQIFHADVDGSTPYLVLEYVHGPTLRQLLDHAGTLSVPVVAAVMSDVAAAVAELHSRGIIHRDIKPSNVLADCDGRVFVTDFGLALRRSHAGGHGAGAAEIDFAGTPAYMAGEMFEGRVSPRSDVYAMGVMAFQLLAGHTPFSGTFHELRDKHLHEPLPSDAMRARGAKPELVEVIERATSKQAMFRYKTAPDFARAMREAAACGMPELARARKRLCDLIADRAAGRLPEGTPAGATATGEVRLPHRPAPAPDEDDSATSLYVETISRIATIKRERRRPTASEGGGSSTALPSGFPARAASGIQPALPETTPGADATGSLAFPAASPPRATFGDPVEGTGRAAAAPAAGGGTPDTATAVPGPVLSVSLLAVIYGAVATVWQFGVLVGARTMLPLLPPARGETLAAYFWLVPTWIVHLLLVSFFVPAGVACLRLRPWGRRLLVWVAAADLAFQFLALLVALAWVEPMTVNHELATLNKIGPAVDRSVLEASVATQWVVQWFALSLFPAFALAVMTRRAVAAAFAAASTSQSSGEDVETQIPPF